MNASDDGVKDLDEAVAIGAEEREEVRWNTWARLKGGRWEDVFRMTVWTVGCEITDERGRIDNANVA